MANENGQPQTIILVGLTQDLVGLIYGFIKNLGSDNERRMIGEKLEGQCNANLIDQLVTAQVEAARERHIAEYLAAEKTKKAALVEAKIDEALHVPNNEGIVAPNNQGDVIQNTNGLPVNVNVDQKGGTNKQRIVRRGNT